MRLILISLISLFFVGCCATMIQNKSFPLTDEQCKDSTVICWGERGAFPGNVASCQQVYGCHDWELHSR
jgi:hypothetical protein